MLEGLAKGQTADLTSTFPIPKGAEGSGPASQPPLAAVTPLTFLEELVCCVVLFFVPGTGAHEASR